MVDEEIVGNVHVVVFVIHVILLLLLLFVVVVVVAIAAANGHVAGVDFIFSLTMINHHDCD